jgi:dihydroorotate dehydrogenase
MAFFNKLSNFVYRNVGKPIFFKMDAEEAHKKAVSIGRKLGKSKFGKKIVNLLNYNNAVLEQNILGIVFRNPVGLAGGFDKNAEIVDIIGRVGFGFAEIGSITAKSSKGNSGVRLWRHPEKNSLRIYLGLNNDGADIISNKLRGKKFDIPVGINVAKTNCAENINDSLGINDYLYTLKKFRNIGDFFVINISCPNSFGGQDFSKANRFEKLIKKVDELKLNKPIFVKLSPDIEKKEIDKILELSVKYKVDGFVCTNLTKKHSHGNGGLSGKSVEKLSNDLIKYVRKKTDKIIIGVGGVFSAEDAYKKIKLGANLVELITGMVYGGPGIIGEINHGIVKLLEKEGYKNISEAVGKGI